MSPGELPRILTLAAWLAGWIAATAGIAGVADACGAPQLRIPIWLLSGGLLLLGSGGLRMLATLLWHGIVGASEEGRRPKP